MLTNFGTGSDAGAGESAHRPAAYAAGSFAGVVRAAAGLPAEACRPPPAWAEPGARLLRDRRGLGVVVCCRFESDWAAEWSVCRLPLVPLWWLSSDWLWCARFEGGIVSFQATSCREFSMCVCVCVFVPCRLMKKNGGWRAREK